MVRSPVPLDGIDEIVSHVQKRFAAKPKVAFAGFGNSGKSSLLNAIYGSEVARVSMRTDETAGPLVAERFGIDFTDTPGVGTGKFSLELCLIHISEPTRLLSISYAVFCLKKKN